MGARELAHNLESVLEKDLGGGAGWLGRLSLYELVVEGRPELPAGVLSGLFPAAVRPTSVDTVIGCHCWHHLTLAGGSAVNGESVSAAN